MRPRQTRVASLAALIVAVAAHVALAQQSPGTRDFDAEIRAALASAKDAAEFEFQGALVRTCLLPQSGGENTTDVLPNYIANPSSPPAS